MSSSKTTENAQSNSASNSNITHIDTDVAIIGGGPAGMAAALSAHSQGVKVTIIERDFELGGILQQCIHNGFGLRYFKEELTGPEYAQRFIDKVKATDIKVLLNSMVIDLNADKTITAMNTKLGLLKIHPKSIILCMGCRERTRGSICTPGTRPAGVYTAGMAQRLINMEGYFPGKRVVILGSGDIGLIMARRLTLEGIKVLCVSEIQPYCSGLVRNRVQCLEDFGIPLYLNHTVTMIKGEKRVTGVQIAEVDDKWIEKPGTEKDFECDTVLFSVGLVPENEISLKAKVELTDTNGPNVNEYCETNISGIFAAGNVLQVHDLVDWVTLESERAGKNAADYVKRINWPGKLLTPIKVYPGNNIGYVLPHRIDYLNAEKTIQFSFRPRSPDNDVVIEFQSMGKVFFERKEKHILPSEMVNVNVKFAPNIVGDEVIVNIRRGEPKKEEKK